MVLALAKASLLHLLLLTAAALSALSLLAVMTLMPVRLVDRVEAEVLVLVPLRKLPFQERLQERFQNCLQCCRQERLPS